MQRDSSWCFYSGKKETDNNQWNEGTLRHYQPTRTLTTNLNAGELNGLLHQDQRAYQCPITFISRKKDAKEW